MNSGESQQKFESPEEARKALKHHGVKGMKWGVRKEYDPSGIGRSSDTPFGPGNPEFQKVVERVTRTDKPQVLDATFGGAAKPPSSNRAIAATKRKQEEKHGLTRNQKIALTFGAATAAAAGYYAYQHYTGSKMPGLSIEDLAAKERVVTGVRLGELKLPAKWDVSGLKNGPISKQALGDLTGGELNAKLHNAENLVINTSRGYADILPKDGFSNPFANEQHASVTRVLEEMRDKYPAVRNMNIEVVPMSHVPGMEGGGAHMAVMSMRAGEARVMYNDIMDKPTAATIKANARFLPGLGSKDYVAYHEMGHLLASAHGDLPASFDLVSGNAGPSAVKTWTKAEPLLHRSTLAKHGFSFKELSKLSQYAATEPAEAMAELAGHYFTPEMRARLTPDQITRAESMFNEMGGLV